MTDEIVELDLGVTPSAGVSGAVCLQTENRTVLTFNAMRLSGRVSPHGDQLKESAGTAVVEFKGRMVSRFGYPNDEARWKIPRFERVSYGIYEVLDPSWRKEIVRLNRFSFPNTPEDYDSRHFLFAFHDTTFEILAKGFKVEVFNEPYPVIFERIQRALIGEGFE